MLKGKRQNNRCLPQDLHIWNFICGIIGSLRCQGFGLGDHFWFVCFEEPTSIRTSFNPQTLNTFACQFRFVVYKQCYWFSISGFCSTAPWASETRAALRYAQSYLACSQWIAPVKLILEKINCIYPLLFCLSSHLLNMSDGPGRKRSGPGQSSLQGSSQ